MKKSSVFSGTDEEILAEFDIIIPTTKLSRAIRCGSFYFNYD
jgi:hypothetical protein